MNRQLEELLLAYDAATQTVGNEALQHRDRFETLLAEVMARSPGLDPQVLRSAILRAHERFVRAQKRNTSLPPEA